MLYLATESRCVKQFLSYWDSPFSSETLIISESVFQKLRRVLFKSSSYESDKKFTDIWLKFDLYTH